MNAHPSNPGAVKQPLAAAGHAMDRSSARSGRPSEVAASPHPWVRAVHALRLQWPWVIFCGIPLSIAFAYAAWTTVPTPYTAYAELLCQPRRFFWETKEDDPKFETYKQTTMRRIKDPVLLAGALRDPEVAKTRYVKESHDVLEQLSQELKISSPALEFIRLELSGENPAELTTILNAVLDKFIADVVDRERDERKDRLGALEKILESERATLNRKRSELQEMDSVLEAATPSQQDLKRQAQVDLQLQIRREMSALFPQIIELELLLKSLDEPSPAPNATSEVAGPALSSDELEALLLQDAQYARIARHIGIQQRMQEEWKRRVEEPHAEIERLAQAMEAARGQLSDRRREIEPALRLEHAGSQSVTVAGGQTPDSRLQLEERLSMLKELMSQYETELSKLQAQESQQAREHVVREALAEDISSLKETVGVYEDEVQRRRIELDKAPDRITTYQRARAPAQPDQKRRYMATLAGAGGGVGLVLGLILLLEFSAHRISESSQIPTKSMVPVLGAVPQVPFSFRNAQTAKQRLAANYWRDVLREAFDGVQSILRHNQRCAKARVMLVASSSEGEGKTTSTTQLALSFARSGYRVLLIDGDLRRPSLEKEFGLAAKPGLCEVLQGQLALDDAITQTELPELDLLTAGQITDKSRGLLARDEHAKLFRELSERYNFILVDSAPVLLSADTMSLAKHVDGVLMMIRKDVTRLRRLEAALHRFELIGVPILGMLSIGLGDSANHYKSYAGQSAWSADRSSSPLSSDAAAVGTEHLVSA